MKRPTYTFAKSLSAVFGGTECRLIMHSTTKQEVSSDCRARPRAMWSSLLAILAGGHINTDDGTRQLVQNETLRRAA